MQEEIKMPRTVAEWDRRYSVKRSIWSHKTNPALRTHVAPIAPGRPLDLGAGKGRSTIWLAKQGWHVAAVDFSSVALAKAEGYAVEAGDSGRIALQSADVTKTTPEEFSFDLVCLMYLHLSHDDMPVIVGKAVDARGPVGAFVLLGHDEINLKHGFGGPHEPNCFYGPEDILEAAGPALSVSETTRVESTRETAFGPRPAIECWVTSQRKPMS